MKELIMIRKFLVSIVAFILLTTSAFGWYDWSSEYSSCYIAGANPGQHIQPTAVDIQDEGGVVYLPLSVRVHTREGSYGFDIQEVKIQWRLSNNPGAGNWTTISTIYSDDTGNFEFDWNDFNFGRQPNPTIDADDVSPGESVLVRIYIANHTAGYQNADLAVDTTAEGTNGWEDSWVMEFDTALAMRF
jgi:hypothetical protein